MTSNPKPESRERRAPESLAAVLTRSRDFSRWPMPPPDPAWDARVAVLDATAARQARKRRLDEQPGLRLTDAARAALESGSGVWQTRALVVVQRWAAGHAERRGKPCLVIGGSQGCGKSVAAAWLIAERGGVWLRARPAVRAFGAKFGPGLEVQDRALNCRTLGLEDVGTERDRDKDEMCALLVELLEQRKGRAHVTLITTNLRREVFLGRYPDARLRSRLKESARWESVEGEDLRARGAAQKAPGAKP